MAFENVNVQCKRIGKPYEMDSTLNLMTMRIHG